MENARVIILAVCFSLILSAPASAGVKIDLKKIAAIESSGRPHAWNKPEDARGLYQIRPILRRDFNQMTGKNYSPDDLWDPEINREIADWYLHVRIPQLLKHFSQPATVDNVLISYNCGVGCVIKGARPKVTQRYLAKYKK